MMTNQNLQTNKAIFTDIQSLIEQSKQEIAVTVNSTMTMLYWNIGKRINQEVLYDKRAEYGRQIVSTLSRQLSWTHIWAIIPMDDPLKREFYIEMCKLEKWSVRTFREQIKSMLYERTAISKKPEETIKNKLQQLKDFGQVSPDLIFRDPYFLDFFRA